MQLRAILCAAACALLVAPMVAAHVSFDPGEWEAGGFARFAVRVPNERENPTVRVRIDFPESVVEARFMPVPGWNRTIQMVPLDEPIEEEGEEPITERIGSVTWSGSRIGAGEFMEFGVSFQVPETVGEDLLFPAIQTYSDGEVVRWIDPDPEAEFPSPRVTVLPAEEEEEGAQAAAAEAQTPASPAATEDDAARGRANLALGLGIAGLVAGLAALGLAVLRRRPA